jgi:hypothetical protein
VSQKATLDTAIGVTAGGTGVSVLMDWIQTGAATVAAVGAAVLVVLRIYYTISDRRNGKRD